VLVAPKKDELDQSLRRIQVAFDAPCLFSALAPVIKERCRMCGNWRHPREFVHNSVTGYCWHCYEWHQHAIAVLAGGVPRGCQGCDRKHEELERLGGSADVKYGMHRRDGIYQLLGIACGCSDEYERKRLDMYGSTPYGDAKKLKG
jgi:hypothetical protein